MILSFPQYLWFLPYYQGWKILKTVTRPISPNVSKAMVNLRINTGEIQNFLLILQHEALVITGGCIDFWSPDYMYFSTLSTLWQNICIDLH